MVSVSVKFKIIRIVLAGKTNARQENLFMHYLKNDLRINI